MRLKYVEIYGFKSFARKTKLTFDSNFVCVVGPNGTGKSNISDAIRWVLGEQSAKALRGSRMEDVIFSGSDQKHPLHMAQVTLCFDNEEQKIPTPYKEVSVTRKVYRSGESEYLLNGARARLKDIRELFMDTGIGVEGYSVIGQGRIDEILSGRSEDRREIFEEASGIAKYKYEKTEALRRLAKTEENLEILESDLTVKSREESLLKKQAENARLGMRLTRELEVHELSLLKKNLSRFETDLEKKNRELSEILQQEEEHTKLRSDLLLKQRPLLEEKEELIAKEGSALKEKQELESLLTVLEKESGIREEQLKFQKKEEDRLRGETIRLSERIKSNEKDCIEKRNACDDLKRKKEILEKEIREEKKHIDADARVLSEKIQEKEESIRKLHEKRILLDYERKTHREQEALHKAEEERLQKEKKERAAQKAEKEGELGALEQSISDHMLGKDTLKDELTAITNREQELRKDLSFAKRDARKISEMETTALSRYRVMKSLQENYEGYYRPVQRFLQFSDRTPALKERFIGVLGELIEVEKGFEVAIQTALGGAVQNIVVETKEDGKYLIDILKKHRLGRLTFLPVDSIQGRTPVYTGFSEEVCNAVSALTFDPKLSGIIYSLLSNTSIVKNMDDALILSRKLRKNRIVTLDGDIINTWGSMVGGSRSGKDGSLLVNRNRELTELEDKLRAIREKKAKKNDLVLSLEKEINDCSEMVLLTREKIAQKDEALTEIKTKHAKVLLVIEHLQGAIDDLEKRLFSREAFSEDEYQSRLEDIQNEEEAVGIEIAALKSDMAIRDEKAKESEKERLLLESRLEYVTRDVNIAENEALAAENLAQELSFRIREITQQLKEVEDFISERQSSQTKSLLESQQAKERLKVLEESLLGKSTTLDLLGSRLSAIRQEIQEEEDLLADLSNRRYRLEILIESAEKNRDDLYAGYCESYDISQETLRGKLTLLEAVSTDRGKVSEIKRRLSDIGYFNYQSIEDYEKLAQELSFLRAQLSDLQKSREDISSLVKNLDKKMVALFKSTFDQINQKYDEIFQILFHGGKGELILEGENVLEADIDIVARPPGKKLASIGLLSGGERSMTALALLFAIFSIRPSPFCVLDEIDAALDEANIDRYVKYLKTLTGKTQFVIITHRKPTMEQADVLYGITMEEGISKVLTLHFEEYVKEE